VVETASYRDVWRGLASQPAPANAKCSVHTIVALDREAAMDGVVSCDSDDSSRQSYEDIPGLCGGDGLDCLPSISDTHFVSACRASVFCTRAEVYSRRCWTARRTQNWRDYITEADVVAVVEDGSEGR